MKSAYELAMERLEKRDGKAAAVTEAQKKALADLDAELKARLAELEIMNAGPIAAARAAGDFEKAATLEEDHRREVARAKDRIESRKDEVRRG
jgi:hypothetical protein